MKQSKKRALLGVLIGVSGTALSAQDSGPGFGVGAGNSFGNVLGGVSANVNAEWQFNGVWGAGLGMNVLAPRVAGDAGGSSAPGDDVVFLPSLFARWNAQKWGSAALFLQGNLGLAFPRSLSMDLDLSGSLGLRVSAQSGLYAEPFLRAGVLPFAGAAYGGGGVMVGYSFAGRGSKRYSGSYNRQGRFGEISGAQDYEGVSASAVERARPDWVRNTPASYPEGGRKVFVIAQKDDAVMYEKGRTLKEAQDLARERAYRAIAQALDAESLHRALAQDKSIANQPERTQIFYDVVLRKVEEDDCYFEIWTQRKERTNAPVSYCLYWGKYSVAQEDINRAQQLIADKNGKNLINARDHYRKAERGAQNKKFDSRAAEVALLEQYFSGIETVLLSPDMPETKVFVERYYQLSKVNAELENLDEVRSGAKSDLFADVLNRSARLLELYDPVAVLTRPYDDRIAALKRENNVLVSKNSELSRAAQAAQAELSANQRKYSDLDKRFQQYRGDAQAMSMAEVLRQIENIESWEKPSPEVLSKSFVHRIEKGDTLRKIAIMRYNSSLYIEWIVTCNREKIRNRDYIRAGDTLKLPDPPEKLISKGGPIAQR